MYPSNYSSDYCTMAAFMFHDEPRPIPVRFNNQRQKRLAARRAPVKRSK